MRAVLAAVAGLPLAAVLAFLVLDPAYPPDLSRLRDRSLVVEDRSGRPLRVFSTADGTIRLPASAEEVAPVYVDLLIAAEDKRFRTHVGVDPLAVGRAVVQAVAAGRVVSGASTLTMQTVRLLEPRPRTLAAKVVEAFRAVQLERRFSKDEILGMYLTLAPFGGRLEGVRAAARAWFGKEPSSLDVAEAALLAALPRAPARLRPDRHPRAARAARALVLSRAVRCGAVSAARAAVALARPLPRHRLDSPPRAFHLARRVRGEAAGDAWRVRTRLDGDLQDRLEALARTEADGLGRSTTVAILAVETASRDVAAWVGSSHPLDEARDGHVDMVTAVRSPGSALKPILYGLAFEGNLLHPQTLIRDQPTRIGGFEPTNFDRRYRGEVTAAEALQLSLNVPAVKVLARLGPVRFVERLRRASVALHLPAGGERPGLAVALGGVGTTLEDLVRLYAALGDDGRARPLRIEDRFGAESPVAEAPRPLFGSRARGWVRDILMAAPRPSGRLAGAVAGSRAVAFKTGTSYGYRDAWAIGYAGGHTIGVWVGRPDGAPSPGRSGLETAAPILLRAFDRLGPAGDGPAAPIAVADWQEPPPPALRRFAGTATPRRPGGEGPAIRYPVDGSTLWLGDLGEGLFVEASGGRRPLTWLVDGRPLAADPWRRNASAAVAGAGWMDVAVVDRDGRSDHARVRVVTVAP